MIGILRKIGIKTRLDLIVQGFSVAVLIFVIIWKLFPSVFNADLLRNQTQKNGYLLESVGENPDLGKVDGKRLYFKKLGKTDTQIKADEIATHYLRAAWIVPQFLPAVFNTSGVGGIYNLSLFSTYITTHILKTIVKKERPDKGNFKSFPSGHTSGTMVLPAFLHKMYSFKIASPFYIFSVATGISRIYSDRHDVYDVIAGAIIGFICGYFSSSIAVYLINMICKRSGYARSIRDYLIVEIK